MKKSKPFILAICFVVIIAITGIFVIYINHQNNTWSTYPASTKTERVGGLIPYNVTSDRIIAIPEEYFLNIDPNMSYDELISEIGEPNGMVGSGIVRDYWRIGENKYAVSGEVWNNFEIWEGYD